MKRVDILYFEAGSGHKTAALALARALNHQHPDWSCRAVDVADILLYDPTLVGYLTRSLISQFNVCMRRERYLGLRPVVSLAIWYSRMSSGWFFLVYRGLSRFWKSDCPDAVISVTPMFNAMLYRAARHTNPAVQCITIPVDYEPMQEGYWFDRDQQQHYLLGADQLWEHARQAGVDASQLGRISGMIVDARFHAPPQMSREELFQQEHLDTALPLGVISFGCQGTVNVQRIAQEIAAARLPVNLVCLCGKNAALREALLQLKTPYPCVPLPFQPLPPCDWLHAADFLIGKPGTMTLTEAIMTSTPFIALASDGLRPIQIGNERYINRSGIGLVAPSVRQIPDAVRRVLSDSSFLQAMQRERHTGIFDAVAAIGNLLGTAQVAPARRAA